VSPERKPIADASAWRGEELERDPHWIHHVGPTEIDEINAALQYLHTKGTVIPFEASDFVAPATAAFLHRVADTLDHGCGAALIRGLPRERYSAADCELICWGLGIQLGHPISQNSQGHRLGHVRDQGKSINDPNVRVYQTRDKLDFHADQLPVDVLGLFCVHPARAGGESKIVSATAIHDVVLTERPDLLEVLYQPFNLDWRGEEPPGAEPWYRVPMYSEADGWVTSRFTSLAYFRSTARFGEEYTLTPAQSEALDLVQDIAGRPEMRLTVRFEAGDIQLLNNHVTLHAREAFEDHPEPERKRHLLRMWLAYPPERRRPLSPLLAKRYELVEAGGIPARNQSSS
jgi:hypothetical protein